MRIPIVLLCLFLACCLPRVDETDPVSDAGAVGACFGPIVPGYMHCAETNADFMEHCKGFLSSCNGGNICPLGWDEPIARDLGVPALQGCIPGGPVACSYPGISNHTFVDCCGVDAVPVCSADADCPAPTGECVFGFCYQGTCRISAYGAGTPCSLGVCKGGWCGPN